MCVNVSKVADRTIAGVKKNPLGILGATNPFGMFSRGTAAWLGALGTAHQSGKK
tara:strand:+ start:339 stop:500 length:162 start_codon:yes stop_codon:yes gene_type:complete